MPAPRDPRDGDEHLEDERPEEPSPRLARPVAVTPQSAAPRTEADAEPEIGVPVDDEFVQPVGPEEPGEPAVAPDEPGKELAVGIACLALAVSVFLPWYEIRTLGEPRGFSGWSSGTWGPVIFFLALAGVAIVALRRIGKPVALPLEAPVVLEGIGWISVLGLFLKRWRVPEVSLIPVAGTRWLIVSIVLAAAVALLAGRLSSGALFVRRPGWLRAPGGRTGAATLAAALVLGLFFGLTNDLDGGSEAGARPQGPGAAKQYKTFPPCAKAARFPVPPGIKSTGGTSYPLLCAPSFTAPDLTVQQAFDRFKTALRARRWRFSDVPQARGADSRALQLLAPQCGTLAVNRDQRTTKVSAFFGDCQEVGRPGDRGEP